MNKARELKRQNFDVDPDQAAMLEAVRHSLHASTMKDAVLAAARVVRHLAKAIESGEQIYLHTPQGEMKRLLIAELEVLSSEWQFLVQRPHPWRKQLYIKGTRTLASTIWGDLIANGMTPADIAEDRDVPLEAVLEAVRYCEQNRALIESEAAEEKYRLSAGGVNVDAVAS